MLVLVIILYDYITETGSSLVPVNTTGLVSKNYLVKNLQLIYNIHSKDIIFKIILLVNGH